MRNAFTKFISNIGKPNGTGILTFNTLPTPHAHPHTHVRARTLQESVSLESSRTHRQFCGHARTCTLVYDSETVQHTSHFTDHRIHLVYTTHILSPKRQRELSISDKDASKDVCTWTSVTRWPHVKRVGGHLFAGVFEHGTHDVDACTMIPFLVRPTTFKA